MTDTQQLKPLWMPIESAPVGEPSMEVGSREDSRPFHALKKNGEVVKVRRIDGNSYDFRGYDEEDTYYLERAFTHWKPIIKPTFTQENVSNAGQAMVKEIMEYYPPEVGEFLMKYTLEPLARAALSAGR